MLPLFWHIFIAEDGLDRASRLARATINTLLRVDVEMFDSFKLSFIFTRMDAINRANVYTSGVFGSNTRFSNDIDCHAFSFSLTSICKCGSTLNQLQAQNNSHKGMLDCAAILLFEDLIASAHQFFLAVEHSYRVILMMCATEDLVATTLGTASLEQPSANIQQDRARQSHAASSILLRSFQTNFSSRLH
jgi:hypothetical protein